MMLFTKPYVVFVVAALSLLSACSTTPQASIQHVKPEHISRTTEGVFCTTGTNTALGGIAVSPNAPQHAIGKCKHPRWDQRDLIVLYFGDGGEQAPPEYLEEELDKLMHPDNYAPTSDFITPAEVAAVECASGTDCNPSDALLRKGVVVHFATDSDVPLDPSEVELVERIARLAKDKSVVLDVIGHTDSTATNAHNVPLSIRRAEAVQKILNAHGLNNQFIFAGGRASASPVATNTTPEGRALNRRTEVIEKKTEVVRGNGN